MTKKELQYQALISDVKRFYKEQEAIHRDETVYLTWFEDCEEINLWTYWQGRGNLDAKVMLVGQDWGSPTDSPEKYMAQFSKINAGENTSYQIYEESITDKHLIRLFSSVGYDVSDSAPWNPDLFFTNYVLGYRNKGFSGKFNSRWLSESKEFFFRLVNIIEPKVIICLGRQVFRGVMMAFDQTTRIGSYNEFITGSKNPVEVKLASGQRVFVFAEAHCGAMGTLNRNRLKDPDGLQGIDLQIKDWKRIPEYVRST